ncbi:hypothetical protein X766_33165 [Mesorhizobium sp. LSJC255A00]|nr:hypothetical protein X766_33165 [Mesorhizobium sp. LSJC255A00]
MIGLRVRCDRLLATRQPQQSRRQHSGRRDQPQGVRQRLAIRQQRHAGAHGAIDLKRCEQRQRGRKPLEHLDASLAQPRCQFGIAGKAVEEAVEQQANHLRIAPASRQFRQRMTADRQAAAKAIDIGEHGLRRHHIIEPVRHISSPCSFSAWEIRVRLRLDQS